MTHIIHRALNTTPPVVKSANGMWVIDQQGKSYIDACGGAAVSCLGHAHPDVLLAMQQQIKTMPYAHTAFFTSEVTEALAAQIVQHTPSSLNHVYFVSGGSEAMESALKMARQYFVEIGQPQRKTFIARRQSYHGNTLGALAVGGNQWRRKQFHPLLIDVKHVSPCYEYRDKKPDESQQDYTKRLLQELEQTIQAEGPETIIAFCAETIVGATAGAVPATPNYFKGVKEICTRYGILYIADEVMCGMGRSGTLYACEQEGEHKDDFVPDLIAIAKGLGGGYQPIGALIAQEYIIDALKKNSGIFQHGHTYLGHSIAASAALAVQNVIQRDNLLQNVQERGKQLKQLLHTQFVNYPHIGDIRGKGLFIGIELVKNKDTKEHFPAALKLHAHIKKEAMNQGLMIYPGGGTIDGQNGDHILLAPPFICTELDINEIVQRLHATLIQTFSTISKETA